MAHTIDQIVREYMIEKGDQTEHSYPRLLTLAINGLRELELDVSGVPKMISLELKDDLTVDLPSDYINYVRIGTCDSSGNIQSLGLNNQMCLPRSSDNCGDPRTEINTNIGFGVTSNIKGGLYNQNNLSEGAADHFRNSETTGRMFGLGGGQNAFGEYRIDHERNTIQFSSSTATNVIVLEYISDLSRADGSFIIHPFIIETLKCYVAWADIRRKKNTSKQDSELARRDFYNAKLNSQRRYGSVNIAEAMQAIRKGFKLAPKL